MSKRCYYETLGVGRTASVDDIKAAYRKLAKELHPDCNPGNHSAEQQFKEINEAYDVLKDGQKRAAYDHFGFAAFENGHGPQRGRPGFDFGSSFTEVFDDIFGTFMGGGRGRRSARGADLRYDMQISLEDALKGRTVQIRVPCAVTCETCGGLGAEPGTMPEICPGCSGHGKVRAQQGFFTIERTCPKCRGQGRFVRKPCKSCGGLGQVQKERTLQVDIPPGVEDGTRIRLSGEGNSGANGSPPGDLYIFLSIAPHPMFQIDAHDLHCRVPIGFATAALGGVIEVPMPSGGTAKITVPEGTQTGHQFRLRRMGMPLLRDPGAAGDLYIEVRVETPTRLSKKQKEMLRAFAEETEGTQPETEGFFTKVKEFLAKAAE